MSGNVFGKLVRLMSYGESHGEAIGGTLEGIPANLPVSIEEIQAALDLRRPGRHAYVSARKERDQIQVLSGLLNGLTTGTSIGLLIYNRDARSEDYASYRDCFRPGHADYPVYCKYHLRDHRGGGRHSGRETAIRVAAGNIAYQILRRQHIEVLAYLSRLGEINCEPSEPPCSWKAVQADPLFCANPQATPRLFHRLNQLKRDQDSIGAEVIIRAHRLPIGLGEPVFDKLDAVLAHALMSIGGVKSVAFGDGTAVIQQRGSEHRDLLTSKGYQTNRAGGILGGLSTGAPLHVRIGIKPTSSVAQPTLAYTELGSLQPLIIQGRHDPCIGVRIVPVAQAMTALVLLDALLQHQATHLQARSSSELSL